MYQKPGVVRFGGFRALTQVGCTGVSDGRTFEGRADVPPTPRPTDPTTDFCAGSR